MCKKTYYIHAKVDVNMGGKVGKEIMYAMYHHGRDVWDTTYCVCQWYEIDLFHTSQL